MLGCRTGIVTMTTQPYFEAFSAEKVPVVVNFIFFFFAILQEHCLFLSKGTKE